MFSLVRLIHAICYLMILYLFIVELDLIAIHVFYLIQQLDGAGPSYM